MGRPIRSKAIQTGYHFDKSGYRDNMQVRCSRCGFICNMDRDLRSHPGGYESWGLNFVQTYQVTTIVPTVNMSTGAVTYVTTTITT